MAQRYWVRRKIVRPPALDVDWNATEHALKGVSITCQHWLTKAISGFGPSGKTMKQRNQRADDRCPICGAPEEDFTHIWKCQDPRPSSLWLESLQHLLKWMTKNQTHPAIATIIIVSLTILKFVRST